MRMCGWRRRACRCAVWRGRLVQAGGGQRSQGGGGCGICHSRALHAGLPSSALPIPTTPATPPIHPPTPQQTPENAKAILARGVAALPDSVKLWMQAARLEGADEAKKRVLLRCVCVLVCCWWWWGQGDSCRGWQGVSASVHSLDLGSMRPARPATHTHAPPQLSPRPPLLSPGRLSASLSLCGCGRLWWRSQKRTTPACCWYVQLGRLRHSARAGARACVDGCGILPARRPASLSHLAPPLPAPPCPAVARGGVLPAACGAVDGAGAAGDIRERAQGGWGWG